MYSALAALPVEAVVAVAHIQPAVVAVLAVVQADSVVTLLAVVALAAANVGFTGNVVADLEVVDALAQGNDLTGPLVAMMKG